MLSKIPTPLNIIIQAVSFVVRNWQTIGPMLAGAFGAVKQAVTDVASYLGQTFGPALAEVSETVRFYLDKIRAFWKAHGAEIMRVVRKIWDVALQITRVILPVIVAVVKGALNIIAGIIRVVAALMRGDWSAAWRGMEQIAKGISGIVIGIVRGLGKLVVILLKAAWSLMVAGARAGFNALAGAAQSGVSRLLSFVSSIPGRVRSALGSLGSLLYSAGSAVIQGFINGITGNLGRLWSIVSGIASTIKSKITGALGIHSPSSVFRGYGENIVEGLQLGIASRVDSLNLQVGGLGAGLGVPPIATAAATAPGDVYVFIGDEQVAARIERRQKSRARVRNRTLGLAT